MKFKVGDKVKIKDNSRYMGGIFAGKTGRIVEIAHPPHCYFPYKVLIDGEVAPLPRTSWHQWWHANEIVKGE